MLQHTSSEVTVNYSYTANTRVYEPSDLRTYRLKLGILIPKYIRTYLGWQRTIGSYTKKLLFCSQNSGF